MSGAGEAVVPLSPREVFLKCVRSLKAFEVLSSLLPAPLYLGDLFVKWDPQRIPQTTLTLTPATPWGSK